MTCNTCSTGISKSQPGSSDSLLPALFCVPTQFAEPPSSAKRTAHASHCPGSVMGSLTVSTEVTKSSARKVGCGVTRETKDWVSAIQLGPSARFFGKGFCPLVQILTNSSICMSVCPYVCPASQPAIFWPLQPELDCFITHSSVHWPV